MKYVMFLRGINVGGIRVPMAELRECLTDAGLEDVKTYLQTGNVTFASELAASELKPMIEKALTARFGYTAFVLLYPVETVQRVVGGYPFEADERAHRYAIFCESQDIVDELASYGLELDPSIEQIAPGPHVVYWQAPKGSSTDTVFSKIIARPKYKSVTTNRNLNTIEKILQTFGTGTKGAP